MSELGAFCLGFLSAVFFGMALGHRERERLRRARWAVESGAPYRTEMPHATDGSPCWCEPRRVPVGSGFVFIHRRPD